MNKHFRFILLFIFCSCTSFVSFADMELSLNEDLVAHLDSDKSSALINAVRQFTEKNERVFFYLRFSRQEEIATYEIKAITGQMGQLDLRQALSIEFDYSDEALIICDQAGRFIEIELIDQTV